jgi:hypothetical protein
MCYKQDGSVRSYRWDRIIQMFVDDSLINPDTGSEMQEITNDKNNPEDYIIPYLPETEDILELSESEEGEDEPFNDAVETLNDSLNDNTDYVTEHEEELKDEIKNKQKNESESTDFDLDNESGKEEIDDEETSESNK